MFYTKKERIEADKQAIKLAQARMNIQDILITQSGILSRLDQTEKNIVFLADCLYELIKPTLKKKSTKKEKK